MTVLLIFLHIFSFNSFSQDNNAILLNISRNNNFTDGNLNQIGNIIECDQYFANNGSAINFNLAYRFFVYDNFYIKPGIAFSNNQKFNFNRTDNFFSRNDITLFVDEVNTESNIDVSSQRITPTMSFGIKAFEIEKHKLFFDIITYFSFFENSTFEQYEKIVSPEYASFINHDYKQVRNINSDNANFLNNQFFVGAGLNYEFQLKYFNLTAGINYAFATNSLIIDNDITNSELSFSLGVAYIIKESEKEEVRHTDPPLPELIEPVKPFTKDIADQTFIKDTFNFKILNDINESFVIYEKEELLASTPLVNSVFYNKNNSEIPANYIIFSDLKSINFDDILEAHNYVIPRIAKVLLENPQSKILLKATHLLNFEQADIVDNRLEKLQDIFEQYGINSDRISTSIDKINNSNINNIDLVNEYFRIDILLNDASFQNYVKTTNYRELNGDLFVDLFASPDNKIDFSIDELNVDKQNLDVGKHNIKVKKKLENNEVINANANIRGSIDEKSFNFSLDPKEIQNKSGDIELDNFEAILRFDFNSSELSNENKELLKQLYELVPKDATIIILGSSDASGSSIINQKLEVERAENTRQYIETLNKKNIKITTGRVNTKFDDNTPQGRFLNRSIRIKLKK